MHESNPPEGNSEGEAERSGTSLLIGRGRGGPGCGALGYGVRELREGVGDDAGGEDFRQHAWLAFTRDVERISWYAATAQRSQCLGNGVVIAGPVGAEKDDVVVGEGFLDTGVAEGDALVDLAAKAPACSEVDENGATLGLIFLNSAGGPRLPDGFVLRDCRQCMSVIR